MTTRRNKTAWVAPRSGGYSARSSDNGKSDAPSRSVSKPTPPLGRGSAAIAEKSAK
jgi:hypothetical protein